MGDIKVTFPGGKKVSTEVGGFTIVTDQGIDTSDLKMELKLEKNDDGDIVKVVTEVTRPKDFPEKYMGAIEHISKACKVKRHIENPPEFEIIVK